MINKMRKIAGELDVHVTNLDSYIIAVSQGFETFNQQEFDVYFRAVNRRLIKLNTFSLKMSSAQLELL